MLTCGTTPVSTGPKAQRLTATLQGPASGQAELSVNLQMAFSSKGGQHVLVNTGAPSTLVIRDGYVTGKYPDGGAVAAIGYTAVAPDGTSLLANVVLSGCPHGPTDPMHPDHSRSPLLPGRYDLVSVIKEIPGTTTEDLSIIVSAPTTIDVTAATNECAP